MGAAFHMTVARRVPQVASRYCSTQISAGRQLQVPQQRVIAKCDTHDTHARGSHEVPIRLTRGGWSVLTDDRDPVYKL